MSSTEAILRPSTITSLPAPRRRAKQAKANKYTECPCDSFGSGPYNKHIVLVFVPHHILLRTLTSWELGSSFSRHISLPGSVFRPWEPLTWCGRIRWKFMKRRASAYIIRMPGSRWGWEIMPGGNVARNITATCYWPGSPNFKVSGRKSGFAMPHAHMPLRSHITSPDPNTYVFPGIKHLTFYSTEKSSVLLQRNPLLKSELGNGNGNV